MKAIMKKSKETKGAWRYAEDSDAPLLGTLYIKKAILSTVFKSVPEKISVVVEEVK